MISKQKLASPLSIVAGNRLKSSQFATPLGPMLAVADAQALYFLAFTDCQKLASQLKRLQQIVQSTIIPGDAPPLTAIEKELQQYFAGKSQHFHTPFQLVGTPFQQQVWKALTQIPLGSTQVYADIAQVIGKSSAWRAVANAMGANPLSIIVPCHRVIRTNGGLGGYAGGLSRKQWLISHEKIVST